MKPFAHDSGADFESSRDPAHASAINGTGAINAGIGRQAVASGYRETDARGYEANASDAADTARSKRQNQIEKIGEKIG